MPSNFDTPLADLPTRVDLFDRDGWNSYLRDKARHCGLVAHARGAFPPVYVEFPPRAVWVFDLKRELLRNFAGEWQTNTPSGDRYESRRVRIRGLIELGIRWYQGRNYVSTIEQFVGSSEALRVDYSADIVDEILSEVSRYRIRSIIFNNNTVVLGLFHTRIGIKAHGNGGSPVSDAAEMSLQRNMGHALKTVYDYFKITGTIWDSCPFRSFSIIKNNLEELTQVFSDPLSFSPRDAYKENIFLWPWQRCLSWSGSDEDHNIVHVSIRTTSLVVDLRGSTAAMGLTPDASSYAQFIDEVVRTAREIILGFGGFFDKDTGDGVVGHFCGMRGGHGSVRAGASEAVESIVDAVLAGHEIIRVISRVCREFQENMSLGLGGLNPAVGIHTGDAVWIARDGQIKAIGSSVVWASRLCAAARTKELLVSNISFNRAKSSPKIASAGIFEERRIRIKDYSASLAPFAYSNFPEVA
jgi:class 3 adenylate cyclase